MIWNTLQASIGAAVQLRDNEIYEQSDTPGSFEKVIADCRFGAVWSSEKRNMDSLGTQG